MSDIESVFSLLCDCVKRCLDLTLKPEYFVSAKNNVDSKIINDVFWELLHKLSRALILSKNENFSLNNDYDVKTRVKLYMAFLRYKDLRFFSLSTKKHEQNKILLPALTYLLIKQGLDAAVDEKFQNSSLGKEFSAPESTQDPEEAAKVATVHANAVVHACGKLGHNLKRISELESQKLNLTAKLHSLGFPHLSVSETSLLKRLTVIDNDDSKSKKQLEALNSDALMLDTFVKWSSKKHIFVEWVSQWMKEEINASQEMTFVLRENKLDEFVGFVSSLRSEIEQCLKKKKVGKMTENATKVRDEDLQKQLLHLNRELESLIKVIPNCVEI